MDVAFRAMETYRQIKAANQCSKDWHEGSTTRHTGDRLRCTAQLLARSEMLAIFAC